MKVSEDPHTQAAIARSLTASYPRMTDDQVREIIRLLGNQEAEQVTAAADRHALSDEGRFPPQAGQLLEHIRKIQAEERRLAPAMLPMRGQKTTLPVPAHMRTYFNGKQDIEVYASLCHECSDTGFARFYHSQDEKWVYLATEALALPEGMFRRLRISRAICDCEAGRCRTERDLWTTRFSDGRNLSVYPRLENIRRLSRKRQRQERLEIGA